MANIYSNALLTCKTLTSGFAQDDNRSGSVPEWSQAKLLSSVQSSLCQGKSHSVEKSGMQPVKHSVEGKVEMPATR